MNYNTIESRFEYQAKQILLKVLEDEELQNLESVDDFEEELWQDKNICMELGRMFMQRLSEYSDSDVYEEVMNQLK